MPKPWEPTDTTARIADLSANAPTGKTVRRANRRTAMKDQSLKVMM